MTPQEAESEVMNYPGIIMVFPGSTISGEKPMGTSYVPFSPVEEED